MMRIVDIIDGTTVDGPGFRTSIYFAGCRHQCPGCHNPSTWSFDAGRDMTLEEVMAEIREDDFDVTLSGGDPLYQAKEILPLVHAIKALGKTVWLFTGFTYEQAVTNPAMAALMHAVDVVVDGPFIESQRDLSLHFRGSSNQRLIDIPATLTAGHPILLPLP